MGDSVLMRTSSLDLRIVHHRQRAVVPDGGIVDEPEQRTEVLAQRPHQIGNLVDLAEVEGDEVQRAVLAAFGFRDGRRQILVVLCRATAMTQ